MFAYVLITEVAKQPFLKTKYETKTYITDEIKEIEETDFSVLEPTKDNRITLITCIANQRAKRLCVIGIGE